MGGNALAKKCPRIPSDAWQALADQCEKRLLSAYPEARISAIPSYRSKPDHGDLDILIADDKYNPLDAAKVLDAIEVARNGPVTSIGVMLPKIDTPFQVDLIRSNHEEFAYSLNYFSYNDTGNLLGRIAHAMGIAHRHDGLHYYVRDNDHLIDKILLTRDYRHALGCIGADVDRFERGFETLDEIFEYVASNHFFNPEIFLLNNRNAKSRVRDKKRPTYTAFLEYCANHPDLPKFVFPDNKQEWIGYLKNTFPPFGAKLDATLSSAAQRKQAAIRLNGEIVAKMTGLQGKELGAVMQKLRHRFVDREAETIWILSASDQDIADAVQQASDSQTSATIPSP